jgi:broad specificity phosphatase PhoE
MPTLTRRRYPERPDCWHVYYGDVRVGTIARRVGNPHDTDPWEWNCGFYPGSHPSDTAATFDQARADFERAWVAFLSKRTEADFQAWRDQQAWTAEKYRRFDRGERMPPDWKPSRHAAGS